VKCPKCNYLGFETGDRCKNCGYDFSLLTIDDPDRIESDLDLRGDDPADAADWLAQVESAAPAARPETPDVDLRATRAPDALSPGGEPRSQAEAEDEGLPLFTPALDDDDEPLIKVPSEPRPPLAVRRTPDTPRLRAIETSIDADPDLESESEPTPPLHFDDDDQDAPPPLPVDRRSASRLWKDTDRTAHGGVSGPGARAAALAIDHLTLGGIDAAVVYFTVRMAGLTMDQWTVLPPVPLAGFLLLIKLSYFCVFTAVGGQTIGKMAARIRVVTADDRPLDAALALRRTLAGLLSAVPLGLGFLPALFGSDRRALHDRLARTRVVALRSA